jgi:hypothetical protein
MVFSLITLLSLSGLVLAMLAMSALEPQIAQNLADSTEARHLADSGLDWAYDQVATATANWGTLLAGSSAATCVAGTNGVLFGAANQTLPGLTAVRGTYTVRVRNDCQPNDTMMTGQAALETAANAATDTNGRVIVEATGTVNNTSRTVSAVLIRAVIPAIGSALAFPGIQADVNFNGSTFTIDGRDTRMTDDIGSPTGTANPVFGITTAVAANTTSLQTNLANYQQNDVYGKNPSGSGIAQGDAAVTTDLGLTSQQVSDFVNQAKSLADLTINTSSSSGFSASDIGAACTSNWSSTTCWGTDDKPKIVYVKGTMASATEQFVSATISGGSTGTGILIIENGAIDITGNFRWHGPIILTGNNVSLFYRGDGNSGIWGSVIVNELRNDGTTNLEGDIRGNAKIAYSTEALELVNSRLARRLTQLASWREK